MKQTAEEKQELLSAFLPLKAIPFVLALNEEYNFSLTISNKRHTKHGDYRQPNGRHGHRISVNGSLNQYAFIITLVHEIAHLIVWERGRRNELPHGPAWKETYRHLLNELLDLKVFPGDLCIALSEHIARPTASSCADRKLHRQLRTYDTQPATLLEELPDEAIFKTYNGRLFRKLKKRRSRYVCEELGTNRMYTFSAVAEVEPAE